MQFTDLTFILCFMPLLMLAYYITRPAYRQIPLLLLSLMFYSCGSPLHLVLICVLTAADTALAKCILSAKKIKRAELYTRMLLAVGIIMNLGILGYYKYSGFIIDTLNRLFNTGFYSQSPAAPLGLSFFTFKALSFLIDTYREERYDDDRSTLTAASYLIFFGQIQSGPISRYREFAGDKIYSREMIAGGMLKFMLGFSKKVILADTLNNITVEIFDKTSVISTGLAWLGAVCYSLQLYYDFSGYSDMAVGISNMLGIKCCENFRFPYATRSVAEFWRRWHISLGSWFRDYVYFPLGGSRVGRFRLVLNLFAVWFLTGLWHGAGLNFIVWGIIYFAAVSFEKLTGLPQKLPRPIQWLYRIMVLLFVNFQWVLFRANSLGAGAAFIKTMCSRTYMEVPAIRAAFLFRDYKRFILVAVVFAFPVTECARRLCGGNSISEKIYVIASKMCTVILFLIALAFVVSGQNNPFLYGNF